MVSFPDAYAAPSVAVVVDTLAVLDTGETETLAAAVAVALNEAAAPWVVVAAEELAEQSALMMSRL